MRVWRVDSIPFEDLVGVIRRRVQHIYDNLARRWPILTCVAVHLGTVEGHMSTLEQDVLDAALCDRLCASLHVFDRANAAFRLTS